jgi:Mg-chelatase subunit ChlD
MDGNLSDWASRRKTIYLLGITLFLASVSFYIFWIFWYNEPNCFDNVKNGDEVGVDCGGSCELVCPASVIGPAVSWDPRIFEVTPGVWNLLIYVENRNLDTMASYLPYKFTIYDKENNLLGVREGATILPKNKTVGIFEGGLTFKEGKIPGRVTFDIGPNLVWKKVTDQEPKISITHSPLLRESFAPRIEANIKNEDTRDVKNIELVVAVFDRADNVIATSRTFLENLKANSSSDVFFTWPKPFDLGVKVCNKDSDIVLAIDRSGSMASISKIPTEPLNSVREAAGYFLNQIGERDRVGLVSFATEASIDNPISSNTLAVAEAIKNIFIKEKGTQYTNIYEALLKTKELFSATSDSQSVNQKVLILLTDGVANRPSGPNTKNEAEEIAYAENEAYKEASSLKNEKVIIYTIGLGKDINKSFLSKIASEPKNFLEAPSTTTLKTVYQKISTAICQELPARIEITYKIFGDLRK